MPEFGEFAEKAKDEAQEHPEQADQGMQKAGEFADQRTGGRYGDQIQQGEQRAESSMGMGGQDQGRQTGQDQGGQTGQDQGGYGQDEGRQDQYSQGEGRQDQGGQDQGGYGDQ